MHSFTVAQLKLQFAISELWHKLRNMYAEGVLLSTDGYPDSSASKCNGLVREKELEPWDGATNEDGLEAIEGSVVDGFGQNEVCAGKICL